MTTHLASGNIFITYLSGGGVSDDRSYSLTQDTRTILKQPHDVWAYALEITAHTGSGVTTIYISSSPALVTKSVDTPPTTTFLTGLIQPGNFETSCFKGGKSYGAASIGFGEIILNNDAGQFDFMLGYAFDGRPAVLRRISAGLVGLVTYPADWTTVYTGTLAQAFPTINGYNDGTLSIQWRDRMAELQVAMPLTTFSGTNVLPDGLEGTADDIANMVKPLILGKVFEMAPVCCNTSKLVYAASPPTGIAKDLVTSWDAITDFDAVTDFFGILLSSSTGKDLISDWDAITDFDGIGYFSTMGLSGIANATVYDSGLEIVQEAEYEDENDMMTNAPNAGYCRLLPSMGYIRFGSRPVGQVTISCTNASGSNNAIGSLTKSVLEGYLRWPASRYNAEELATLDRLCPSVLGTVVKDSSTTIAQVLDILSQSVGVCYTFDPFGVFRAFQVRDPSDLEADFSLTDLHMESLSRVNNETIPSKAVRIKQQKCWTVQKSGLVGAVTAARQAWVSKEWRESLATSTATAEKHLLSETLEFDTALAVDGQPEAERRLGIYSVRRDFWETRILPSAFDFTSLRLGMVGDIHLSGRFGYTESKKMFLLGISADLTNETTTLALWG